MNASERALALNPKDLPAATNYAHALQTYGAIRVFKMSPVDYLAFMLDGAQGNQPSQSSASNEPDEKLSSDDAPSHQSSGERMAA
ncbi:MAG TPA: hypothetical protein VIF02_07355 [Methylocella sp.]